MKLNKNMPFFPGTLLEVKTNDVFAFQFHKNMEKIEGFCFDVGEKLLYLSTEKISFSMRDGEYDTQVLVHKFFYNNTVVFVDNELIENIQDEFEILG